jgi:hypothetical protein
MRPRRRSSKPASCRPARVRRRRLRYSFPIWGTILVAAVIAALATVAAITGYRLIGGLAVGVVLLAWLGLALRLTRVRPAGPGGGGSQPPGGAGMREPRRPLPQAPAGAAAMPIPAPDLRRSA